MRVTYVGQDGGHVPLPRCCQKQPARGEQDAVEAAEGGQRHEHRHCVLQRTQRSAAELLQHLMTIEGTGRTNGNNWRFIQHQSGTFNKILTVS